MAYTASVRQRTFYTIGQLGGGVYNGFNNAILSLYVSAFTGNPFIIGYLSNTRTVEGVVIQPLIGRWSDRMVSPLGRRRPFILFGIPVAVFFLLLVPIFAHTGHALSLIAASIILFSIFWNVAADPYQALMVDITPPNRRSIFNAILSIVSLVGQVVILVYAAVASLKKNDLPDPIFYVCAGFILASFAVVFLFVREPRQSIETAERESSIPLSVYLSEVRVFREARKLLVSVFFLWTGLNAILPFISIFPVKIVHSSKSQALIIYMTIILASAICAYPFGKLGARYGNRPCIIAGTVLLIAAAIWGLFVNSVQLMFPLAVLAGAGFSATTVLTYPYLSQLVPGSKIGLFTGMQTAFSAVAVPVSVVVTGVLIDRFGYRSIFAVLAVMMAIDILVLLTINEAAAYTQIERVEEEERRITGGFSPAPSAAQGQ